MLSANAWLLIKAEFRMAVRGSALRVALVAAAVVGWSVGGVGGAGAGAAAYAVGNAACIYGGLVAVVWLALTAGRETSSRTADLVYSKPQPMERIVMVRFIGGFVSVALMAAAMFAGAVASRVVASGSLIGMGAFALQFVRVLATLGFASGASYCLASLAGTPLAGILVAMLWLTAIAGKDFLAKPFFPFLTQNLPAYTALAIGLVGLAAWTHRRRHRGARPAAPLAVVSAIGGLLGGGALVYHETQTCHDPISQRDRVLTEIQAQDMTMTETAPGLLLPDQSGRQRSLSDYRGRVLAVALWTPDNPESSPLLTRLAELQRSLGSRGLQVVSVCLSEDDGAAATFASGDRLPFPVLTDWGTHSAPRTIEISPTAAAYRALNLPYVAVTDRRRRVRDTFDGAQSYDGSALKEAIERRFAEEPE